MTNGKVAPTCFVISPIGEKGSEVRQHADDLYELLIEPALEKFYFTVLRADKLPTVGSITSEVIELIQKSELCVIDVTGTNPNVMYECGRRHETGKPSLMIARQGEKLPFDINTIRTVFFDLSSPRETRRSVQAIQELVSRIVEEGFEASSSGDSLGSLAESIRRIERRLDALGSTGSKEMAVQPGSVSTRVRDLIRKYGLISAYNFALSEHDVSMIDELVPRLRPNSEADRNYYIAGLGQGAALGSAVAFEMLLASAEPLERFGVEDQKRLLGCLVSGANRLDREAECLELLGERFSAMATGEGVEGMTDEDRAYFLNQWQRLLNGVGEIEESMGIGEMVLKLCPDDPSYIYNHSINAREAGDLPLAEELTDRLLRLNENSESPSSDHLIAAIRLYKSMGREGKTREAFDLLNRFHPMIAVTVEDEL